MNVEKIDSLCGVGIILVTDEGNLILKYPDILLDGEKMELDTNEIISLIKSLEGNISDVDCLKSAAKMFLNSLIQKSENEVCIKCGNDGFNQETISSTAFKQCDHCKNITTYKLTKN